MAAADEIGSRIAAARGKTIGVRLPKRARRTLSDSIPWLLAAGAIPLLGLLIWLLRRPHHRRPPGGTGLKRAVIPMLLLVAVGIAAGEPNSWAYGVTFRRSARRSKRSGAN